MEFEMGLLFVIMIVFRLSRGEHTARRVGMVIFGAVIFSMIYSLLQVIRPALLCKK